MTEVTDKVERAIARFDRVTQQLVRANIGAAAIHGNKSQSAREAALAGFKRGDTNAADHGAYHFLQGVEYRAVGRDDDHRFGQRHHVPRHDLL